MLPAASMHISERSNCPEYNSWSDHTLTAKSNKKAQQHCTESWESSRKKMSCSHLRNSICQSEFKVHAFEWVTLIEINETVEAVKCHLINQIVLGLAILLLGFDPTVLNFASSPEMVSC